MTIYIGYSCTVKYISNPTTVHDDTTSISELPPLQWSICKHFTVTTCTFGRSDYFGSLFEEDYTDDTECIYELGSIPNHAKSEEEFWKLLKRKDEWFSASDFIKSIDMWNRTSEEWMHIFGNSRNTTEEQRMFRYSIRNRIKQSFNKWLLYS